MVTIKDIAKTTGFSVATVSRALNDSALISLETRQKIKRVAESLHYHKNRIAQGLNKGNLSVIGLLISDITNPFNAEAVRGVEDAAQKHGYGVILCNTDEIYEKEAFYAEFLSTHRVAGAIVTSAMLQDPIIARLHQKLPMLLLSRIMNEIDINYVACDDFEGGKIAVEHLIDLGHKRIGFIGGPRDTAPCSSRFLGYRQALKDHKLSYRKAWVDFGRFDHKSGYQLGCELLRKKNRPSAIFAASDFIAIGVMEAAAEAGLAIPEDLAIVGYDNVFIGALSQIQLTTVSQSIRKMGNLAAESLFKIIDNPGLPPVQITIPSQLVIRGSCGST